MSKAVFHSQLPTLHSSRSRLPCEAKQGKGEDDGGTKADSREEKCLGCVNLCAGGMDDEEVAVDGNQDNGEGGKEDTA